MVSHGNRPEEMQHMASLASSGVVGSHPSLTSNFSSMMEENYDYMDYTGGGSPLGLSSESSNQDRSCTSTPVGNDSSPAGNTISIPTATGAKKRFWIIEDMSPFGKRRKTASSRKMLDEGMMLEGFRRYDLYEDCKDTACQFSLKVTHYHCTRENCGYKFCGRTHMYKHAQHHDRVDNLVLDDFKRFKSSLCCNFPDCQFSGNSTHFHCLRCGFRCTDSTKVTAHRKHHGKQDVISAAGFCQFSSSVDCEVADCKYKLKCSHFHCTYPECKHTVVGMSQMDSHKRKHEKQERGELPSVSPNQDGNHHHHHHAGLAVPPMPMNRPPTSPGTPGLTHNNMAMYLPSAGAVSEYEHLGSAVNLDSSLNLGTDTNSSLFFLKNAAGLGLSDSMDLSKKMHREPLSLATSFGPAASMGLSHPQDDTTGTSGDPEDDLSAEEEPIAEEDDEDDDDEEEDMNTDSYEDSMPEPEVDKDNGESFDASMNHAETSQLDKEEPEAEP
uniref:C2H2-type domain-containing protein n=1 Tax=Sinocyclocheilus anshuiensis TaxID=1608454 RepID=A0A671MA29_9TELE